MLGLIGGMREGEPGKELAGLKQWLPAPDYAAFAAPGRVEALGHMMREALRQGAQGAAWDLDLYTRDFGFGLEEIEIPLTLFHGERDTNAPLAMVRRAVAQISGARLITYADEAHLSTLCNHLPEIVGALAGRPT